MRDSTTSKPAKDAPSAAPSAAPRSETWAPLPKLDAGRKPAKPGSYPATSKDQRFVIFAASWCGGCVASVVQDAELARRYAGKMEVAVALQEENESFEKASMARWLSDVKVYDQDSTKALAETCQVRGIPSACLLEGEKVLWTGSPGDGVAIIDGQLAGKLDEVLARGEKASSSVKAAMTDASKRPAAVAALHGFAGRQNSIAWNLVDKDKPSELELALGVALARDAVDATGATDFAILDTYELGLTKSHEDVEAVRVAKRVIEVCDAVGGHCGEERSRAEKVIASAR